MEIKLPDIAVPPWPAFPTLLLLFSIFPCGMNHRRFNTLLTIGWSKRCPGALRCCAK
jgi:hypothetical protein